MKVLFRLLTCSAFSWLLHRSRILVSCQWSAVAWVNILNCCGCVKFVHQEKCLLSNWCLHTCTVGYAMACLCNNFGQSCCLNGCVFLRSGSSAPMVQTVFSEAFGALHGSAPRLVEYKKVILHWDRSNMASPHEWKIVCYSNFSRFKQTISLLFGASRFLHLELVFSGIWSAPMEQLLKKMHPKVATIGTP